MFLRRISGTSVISVLAAIVALVGCRSANYGPDPDGPTPTPEPAVTAQPPTPAPTPCPNHVDSPHGSVAFGSIACSPDGARYVREVEPQSQGQIGVFEDGSDQPFRVIDMGESANDPKGLAWSPDSTWLAVMYHHGNGGYVRVLDAETGAEIDVLWFDGWYHSMCFEPDGQHINVEGDLLPIPAAASPAPGEDTVSGEDTASGEDTDIPQFLLGVNYPWFNYGHDFGRAEPWDHDGVSHPNVEGQIDAHFAHLKDVGVHTIRWFVFGDGRAAPEFDDQGLVTGYDEFFYADMDAALDIAEDHDMHLIFVLLDYQICKTQQESNGVQLYGRCDLVTSLPTRNSFLEYALKPLLERYGNHPSIIAWEVMNEPEWVMVIPGGGTVGTPVEAGEMQAFVGGVVEYIHTFSSHDATLGSATRGFLVDYWTGIPLDFYQFHYYDNQEGKHPLDYLAADLGLDKPVIVGEYPTKQTSRTVSQYLDLIWNNGYDGALAWSFRAEDDFSDFASGEEEFAAWSETHHKDVLTMPD